MSLPSRVLHPSVYHVLLVYTYLVLLLVNLENECSVRRSTGFRPSVILLFLEWTLLPGAHIYLHVIARFHVLS